MSTIRKYFDPYVDLRAIGLFRILLFGVLIIDLLVNKWPNLVAFYTDQGILDSTTLEGIISAEPNRSPYGWGLLSFVSSKNGVGFFFIVTLVFYVASLVGYRTRLFSVLSFMMLWSPRSKNSSKELRC